jgi:hypothetical protein
MLKERKELENVLSKLIIENNNFRATTNAVKQSFIDRNIPVADFMELWTQRKPLEEADMITIFVLTQSLHSVTKNDKIKIENWFTETEIKDGINYKRSNLTEKAEYPLVVANALQGKEDQYITYLPAKTIKLWFDSDLLPYNFNTQRNPRVKTNENGELIKTANIKTKSVNEIARDIETNNFITNCITLNLLHDGTDYMEYNNKKQELIIRSGQLNPIDGFHRIQGMMLALAKNPKLDYITEVRITNWDVQKCRNFIFQEDKRNKIDKRYMHSIININKWGNKVTRALNEGSYDLNGKIVTDKVYIRNGEALTLFNVMSDTIDELYEIKTNKDVIDLSKWLGGFFDYIIGSYPHEFVEDIDGTKASSTINMPLTFVGYLALSKKLYGQENWELQLTDALSNIDFSLENPVWEQLAVTKDGKYNITFSKPIMKKIIEYFGGV